MRKLKKYKPTKFKEKTSVYNKDAADFAVMFIEQLCHTKGTWAGQPFELIDWQEQIIRDLFGILKPNGYRQFNTAYVEIPKKQGKSELAAAVALLLTCGDGEERAEVYGCAADRQQAAIVFDVAADIHNPSTIAAGERRDMEQAINMLDAVKNSIIEAYRKKTGISEKALSDMMNDETWMNANMAIKKHFADGYIGEKSPAENAVMFARVPFMKKVTAQIGTQNKAIPADELYSRLHKLKSNF